MDMAAKKTMRSAGRVFDSIADVGSLFMAILYILYVALLLIFHLGTLWLNYFMLAITILYIAFFIVKLVSLNKILEKNNVGRNVRFILKYSKWSMKIVNASFVIIAIATTSSQSNNIIMMLGIFLVGFSFLISVMWDIGWFVARRKLGELKDGWDNLSLEEKHKRIEMFLGSLMKSLDSITGVDVAKSLSITASADRRRKKQVPKDTKQATPQAEQR